MNLVFLILAVVVWIFAGFTLSVIKDKEWAGVMIFCVPINPLLWYILYLTWNLDF